MILTKDESRCSALQRGIGAPTGTPYHGGNPVPRTDRFYKEIKQLFEELKKLYGLKGGQTKAKLAPRNDDKVMTDSEIAAITSSDSGIVVHADILLQQLQQQLLLFYQKLLGAK